MKGQRLFIRPIEASDHEAIRQFLGAIDRDLDAAASAESASDAPRSSTATNAPVPACGLLGKLVGDLVAVVGLEITSDAVRVTGVAVAPELRRKRIGRFMLDEAASLAKKMDRHEIVADCNAPPAFLRRVGFREDGERWVRAL